ncbi:Hypothetical predicted protein [Cloeon dipterum]|uniref:Uncharacterized protein n=1 Tax=Cloeon dipterum TaxID=197152 RepID=A0A8S1E558_9INSE|nr:Hypothetical predicted protein [Cloeon dipterum]
MNGQPANFDTSYVETREFLTISFPPRSCIHQRRKKMLRGQLYGCTITNLKMSKINMFLSNLTLFVILIIPREEIVPLENHFNTQAGVASAKINCLEAELIEALI